MFNKKSCKKCGEKVSGDFNFCPYCNTPLKKEISREDWGMLGKNDAQEDPLMKNPLFGGFADGMLNKMLGSAMKMLEKEMQKEMNQQKNGMPKTNVRLMINGKEVNLNNVQENKPQKIPKNLRVSFSKESSEKFSKLPKKEPKTSVKRLSDKIIYELDIPGIKSLNDISILQLENSIEVKAVAKNNAYVKIIQIGLPVVGYGLTKDNLFLEFPAQ